MVKTLCFLYISIQQGRFNNVIFILTITLTMNFRSLAQIKYKRSVVSGMVYCIHRACSIWANFHESLEKAKTILQKNQYPPSFYEPIIHKTLSKICNPEAQDGSEEWRRRGVRKSLSSYNIEERPQRTSNAHWDG